mmetsp:Transcript_40512/g.59632  ORF Transcript_40512/g.59632 Transcript_40512/m.59632 type:complete len:494 (-) Transcript_40512:197-1678(-)
MGCKDSKPDDSGGFSQFNQHGLLTHGHFDLTTEEEAAHVAFRQKRVYMENIPDVESKVEACSGIWAEISAGSAILHTAGDHMDDAQAASGNITASGNDSDAASEEHESQDHEVLITRLPPETLSKVDQHKYIQNERQRLELLTIDPSSWEVYAKDQMFQKAEDQFVAAQEAEFEVRGKTGRLALLKAAVGAIYDYRSNMDQTGQQHQLSLEAARHCRDALRIWRELTGAEQLKKCKSSEAQDRLAQMSETLVLMGRGLCNFALDGDGPALSAHEAFEEAEVLLQEALQIRNALSPGKKHSPALAEARMALGYWAYCKAGSFTNAQSCTMHNSITTDDVKILYETALEHYLQSLNLYVNYYGKGHVDSIRMMCNIGLVYKAMAIALPEHSYQLKQAATWYSEAYELQERGYGKYNDRTKKIKGDLATIQGLCAEMKSVEESVRSKQLAASLAPGGSPASQIEKDVEAKQLMADFLSARRSELQVVGGHRAARKT